MSRFSTRYALTLATLSLLTLGACSSADPGEETAPAAADSASTGESGNPSSTPEPGATTPTPAELVGGGQEIFPDRRFVALYGSPGTPALGILGEYEPRQAVERVKALAEQHQPYSKEPVQGAFEIIATVASSKPGSDGDYSDEIDPKRLLPLIEEAEKNGIYVILDLQPGRDSFPHQIQEYKDLLKRPNVGLGIDPEWRLEPWQVHLQQIGSVSAAEVNKSLDALAQLVREENLPQKLVVLHQFTPSMLADRELITTDRPELALTLHADGHGTPQLKKESYAALLQGLDPAIYPSWKNFYDEDTPMLTPQETYQVTPQPWVVTYQ